MSGSGQQQERNGLDAHKAFIQMIPDFFQDRLEERELRAFLEHYDACAECQDEVSIQYLIHEGLARLEAGRPFHLQRELNEFMGQERQRLHRRECFTRGTFVLELIAVLSFAAFVLVCLWQGLL